MRSSHLRGRPSIIITINIKIIITVIILTTFARSLRARRSPASRTALKMLPKKEKKAAAKANVLLRIDNEDDSGDGERVAED